MIAKFTFAALLLASTIGVCPMQLNVSMMDHEMMNMNMADRMPCSDCITATEHYALNDAQNWNPQLPLLTAAAFPEEYNATETVLRAHNTVTPPEGPHALAPPLIGTVILRT